MGSEDMAPERQFESSSPEATEALGEQLGHLLPAGSVVTLDGELGSGKTCLVRGLARGLGILGPISSPSYTLMVAHGTEEEAQPGGARCPLYHYDAWMEGREKAFLSAGGAEWLHADGIAAIEWGARLGPLVPEDHLSVRLSHRSPQVRSITVSARGAHLLRVLGDLEQAAGLEEVRPS
ncbi:MAG TPA: tRNA (adenosine(37)-N6)-threonylcarbamoyltransferase complex ATPase subunit type 1 TsaE [Planctomycetota bacterium]|nr:tRNA (adenosine(37)-N6)-threonylcarbamoyltransferase complex ATPase subunit type 1 TsaE [Planctomycetota bacterium]